MEYSKCDISYDEGILIINLSGDIDHHSASKIREEIDAALYLYRASTVIMDLGAVDFMDSSGLGLILGRYTKINSLGGRLILANPSENTEKILILSGADKMITVKNKEKQS